MIEEAFTFDCQGRVLPGVLHRPNRSSERGVLVVVGGPQYRVGSHRQFVLLGRALAAAGFATLRFDHRGIGDADGELAGFEAIGPDIRAAVDALFARVDGLREVVIWGLCDAASAAVFYAGTDHRVGGLVLLNPWVRTELGEAKARVIHYYRRRVATWAFWRKLVAAEVDIASSVRAFAFAVRQSRARASEPEETLPQRIAEGLEEFQGRVLIVLSGQDLTAEEFKNLITDSQRWQRLMAQARVRRVDLPAANHTFSSRNARERVARETIAWLKRFDARIATRPPGHVAAQPTD